MAKKPGKPGGNISYTVAGLSGIELAQAKQEAYWARKTGTVQTRQLTPEEQAARPKAKRVIVDSPFRRSTRRAEGPSGLSGTNGDQPED